MGFVLVLGGARSGKSDLAMRLGTESGRDVTFIATATPGDAEMAGRIERHQAARPSGWSTVEAPLDLAAALHRAPATDFVIVDCLTLWVSNLLGEGSSAEQVLGLGSEAARAMSQHDGAVVSNEVGLGIVPANEMARAYRDVLGGVNAIFAETAERAVLMVAGRALELKPA
ncbi:MAG TPA: bifunctional adenosylcobinamide kinase/adenosylcobinamide-phosphate guanylyltransferase [Candidatus Dormibacteraeota bacterium]|nr:bifunctional adenosylcobinamide kinase/adenosylcobinamide-phosphate guanylyltransferase [Candidatus Dormibacteraeota bacterium]